MTEVASERRRAHRYHRLKRRGQRRCRSPGACILLAGLLVTGCQPAPSQRRRTGGARRRLLGPAARPSSVYVVVLALVQRSSAACRSRSTAASCSSAATVCRTSARAAGCAIRQSRSASELLLAAGAAALVYVFIRRIARSLVAAGRRWSSRCSSSAWPTSRRCCSCRSSIRSSRSTARRCGRGCSRSPNARAPACSGAYEWGLGEKTKKANAALAGLGGDAADPRVRHDARRIFGRGDRGRAGARARAPRARRHLEGHRVRERADRGRLLSRVAVLAALAVPRAFAASTTSPGCRCCCSPPERSRW